MARLSSVRFNALAPGKRLFIGERGLFLFSTPSGIKSWRMQPRVGGKRQTVVLGRWPDVSLDDAKTLARQVSDQAKQGLHPRVEKVKVKHANIAAQRSSVASLWADYFARWGPQRSNSWRENTSRWWTRYLAPEIGSLPARDVTGPPIIRAMERARDETSLHAAHSVRQLAAQVLDQAVALGHLPANPARSLTRSMPRPAAVPLKAMSLEDCRRLWAALDDYPGTEATVAAIRLLLLTGLRVSEVVNIQTAWINSTSITLPRSAMKVKSASRGDFIVPLSRAAREVVGNITENGALYLFPGFGARRHPMHKSAVNNALIRMGFDHISPHSVRNAFSTVAHGRELAIDVVIEAALDHARGWIWLAAKKPASSQQRRQAAPRNTAPSTRCVPR
jgi:integrase